MKYRMWTLTTADDGAVTTDHYATKQLAWDDVFNMFDSTIEEWWDEEAGEGEYLALDRKNLTDDQENAIQEALAAAGIDVKVEEEIIDVTGYEVVE